MVRSRGKRWLRGEGKGGAREEGRRLRGEGKGGSRGGGEWSRGEGVGERGRGVRGGGGSHVEPKASAGSVRTTDPF